MLDFSLLGKYAQRLSIPRLIITFLQIMVSAAASSNLVPPSSALVARSPTATAVVLHEAAASKGAVCLDGSPAVYYVRPGVGPGLDKWVVFFEGGGWCQTAAGCKGRSFTRYGSSTFYPPTVDYDREIFSTDPNENPMLWNWNFAVLQYCDGSSFTSDNQDVMDVDGVKLHFRGKRIRDAVLDDLMHHHALGTASNIIVTGCSAGGLAAYLHVDHIADLVPSARTVGLSDSGFFPDVQLPTADPVTQVGYFHEGQKWVYSAMNSSSGVPSRCVAAMPSSKEYKCIFAQYVSPFLQTPVFALQSQYDSWSMPNLFNVSSVDSEEMNSYGRSFSRLLMKQLLSYTKNGALLDSCFHHCGGWTAVTQGGLSQARAFESWYENLSSKRVWVQDKPYPCSDCCGKMHSRSALDQF